VIPCFLFTEIGDRLLRKATCQGFENLWPFFAQFFNFLLDVGTFGFALAPAKESGSSLVKYSIEGSRLEALTGPSKGQDGG